VNSECDKLQKPDHSEFLENDSDIEHETLSKALCCKCPSYESSCYFYVYEGDPVSTEESFSDFISYYPFFK